MCLEFTPDADRLLAIKGRLMRDGLTGRIGTVMDLLSGDVYLRPPGGGREWTTPIGCLVALPDGHDMSG